MSGVCVCVCVCVSLFPANFKDIVGLEGWEEG